MSLQQRFDAKVDKNGPRMPHMKTRCHVWTGAVDGGGYGQLASSAGKSPHKAHRLALEKKLGRPIAKGMRALHACDNPPCVREEHLSEGTHSQNIFEAWDRSARGRKLSAGDIAAIRASLGSVSQRKLARLYGVSESLISQVALGRGRYGQTV